MWIAFSLLLSVLVAGVFLWHWAGARMLRNVGSPEYSVIARAKRYEIRQYESFAVATVEVKGAIEEAVRMAFPILYSFVAPSSFSDSRVDPQAEDFEKTRTSHDVSFALHIDAPRSSQSVADPKLAFSAIPSRVVVAYPLRWSLFRHSIQYEKNRLFEILYRDGITPIGDAELVFYSAPHSLPFFSRAELLVEI